MTIGTDGEDVFSCLQNPRTLHGIKGCNLFLGNDNADFCFCIWLQQLCFLIACQLHGTSFHFSGVRSCHIDLYQFPTGLAAGIFDPNPNPDFFLGFIQREDLLFEAGVA